MMDILPDNEPFYGVTWCRYVITGTLSLLTLTFALFWISNDILMPRTVQVRGHTIDVIDD
jgi:hypothetical protein